MKFQIINAVLIAIVILVGFSAASSSGDTTIEGNINDELSLTVDPTHLQMNLIAGNTVYMDGKLIVTANGPWQVTVKSDQGDGLMKQWNGETGQYVGGYSRRLSNPFSVSSPPHGISKVLNDQDQILIPTNSNFGDNMEEAIQFIQRADSANDIRLDPPNAYHILVTFTATMSY